MKYFISSLTLIAILYNPIEAKAQCQVCNHLEPVNGVLGDWIFIAEYDLSLQDYFLKDLPDDYQIRYIVKDEVSQNEYVLQITRDVENVGVQYDLLVGVNSLWHDVVLRKNIFWDGVQFGSHDENRPPIPKNEFKINHYKAFERFDEPVLLKDLLETVILQTKYYSSDNYSDSDSANTEYFFSVYKDGIKSGQIRSPNEGSKMHRLVSIFEEICERVKKERKRIVDYDLQEEIYQLLIDVIE